MIWPVWLPKSKSNNKSKRNHTAKKFVAPVAPHTPSNKKRKLLLVSATILRFPPPSKSALSQYQHISPPTTFSLSAVLWAALLLCLSLSLTHTQSPIQHFSCIVFQLIIIKICCFMYLSKWMKMNERMVNCMAQVGT